MITSASNPRLKLVRRLESRRQRERLGLFVCEGEDLVDAGLAAGAEPVEVGRPVRDGAHAALARASSPPSTAWAAARRAMGTRKGEQET